MGDLLHTQGLKERLRDIVEWKNITLHGYGTEIDADEMYDWLMVKGEPLLPRITDTTVWLHDATENKGADVMFEAQLGALRDIDFGIYPYTSSSTTLAAYAPIGAGVPAHKLDRVIGIMKAYSSCVGEGPFTCEFSGNRRTSSARSAASTVRRPEGRGASAVSMWLPAAMACVSRARPR